MSSNLPPVVPVFSGMQFNSGFYAPNNEPTTYEQTTTAFAMYPNVQGDMSLSSATFFGNVVVQGDVSVDGTINGVSNGSIIATLTMDVSNQIIPIGSTPVGNLVLPSSTNYVDVVTNNLPNTSYIQYSRLGSGVTAVCYALVVDSDGSLYAGGGFSIAGGISVKGVAKWDGSAWSSLPVSYSFSGATLITVRTLSIYNNVVYAGGTFDSYLAKWNGIEFQKLPNNNINAAVIAIETANNTLYIGGLFTTPTGHVAQYNLNEQTPPVSINDGFNGGVTALKWANNTLYAGGSFTQITSGSVTSNRIAKLVGSQWVPLTGTNGGNGVRSSVGGANVNSIVYDNVRNRLYVGGLFNSAGDVSSNNVAIWDMTTNNWIAIAGGPTGTNAVIQGMYYDNAHEILYVTGTFTTVNVSTPALNIAAWDVHNNIWNAMSSGLSSIGNVITKNAVVSNDPVFVGGQFTSAGGISAIRVASIDVSSTTVNVIVNNQIIQSLPSAPAANSTCLTLIAGNVGYSLQYTPNIA